MVRGHAKQVAREKHDAKAADKLKSTKREGAEVRKTINALFSSFLTKKNLPSSVE